MPGFILLDKPAGRSSHWFVSLLRRVTGVRRIGHAGTLDPFATGLLVMGVGREATRLLGGLTKGDKEYVAVALLGATSDTQDLTGVVTPTPDAKIPTEAEVRAAATKFVGPQLQTPPMYSAKKIGGQKLYDLARAGQTVEREPRAVTVHELEILDYSPPRLTFRTRVTAGTYIRTIAHDLGQALGCGAYLEELRRTAAGPFRVEDAVRPEELTPENWQEKLIPPEDVDKTV